MLRKLAILAGIGGGLIFAVLITTGVDDTLAQRWRGLLNAVFIVSATTATFALIADVACRHSDAARTQMADTIHDEVRAAVADAYRTATVIAAGTVNGRPLGVVPARDH